MWLKRRIIPNFIAAVFLLAVGLGVICVRIYEHIDDAYAQWGAAEMVIDYMRDHDEKWPPGWDELSPYFARNNGMVVGWPYTKFQSHVFIDFTADSEQLRRLALESDSVPFDVIHASSVWGLQFEDGPNGILARYFRTERNGSRKLRGSQVTLVEP